MFVTNKIKSWVNFLFHYDNIKPAYTDICSKLINGTFNTNGVFQINNTDEHHPCKHQLPCSKNNHWKVRTGDKKPRSVWIDWTIQAYTTSSS